MFVDFGRETTDGDGYVVLNIVAGTGYAGIR